MVKLFVDAFEGSGWIAYAPYFPWPRTEVPPYWDPGGSWVECRVLWVDLDALIMCVELVTLTTVYD